ncbi:MAG TPA: polysaccharide deacetylase family protein [Vicinamibacterales bacterium]|nr:polysaccharide deacetylase family protein [Vicinamibacterales bacterium]
MVLRFLSQCFDSTGLNAVVRKYTRNRIVVLMYHGLVRDDDAVDGWSFMRAAEFDRQMAYLSQHCEVISLRQARLENGKPSKRKRVVITFDDGYGSNYHIAFPILKKYGFPATVFVATKFVETGDMFWYDKVSAAVRHWKERTVDLTRWGLGVFDLRGGAAPARWSDTQRILTRMKALTADGREEIANHLIAACKDESFRAAAYEPLSPAMLAEMTASGLVEIAAHTHGHEMLIQHPSAEVRETLLLANTLIAGWTGGPPKSFSYPNGDFNDTVKECVREAGYDCALTTEIGEWTAQSDPLQIPRVGIGAYHSLAEFAVKVSGTGRIFEILWFLMRRGRPSARRE